MATFTNKLIILRGNSGSGKSTVAMQLREHCAQKIAIVEQDYLRRVVLKEKEAVGGDNIELIYQTVVFALERNYDVILEGILSFTRYGNMLQKLISSCSAHYLYYFDISFKETLNRHETKPNAHEFGKKEMRKWYINDDRTHFLGEQIIPEIFSLEETVDYILNNANLSRKEDYV